MAFSITFVVIEKTWSVFW